jgi:hypothetical protein
MGIMAQLEMPGRARKFKAPVKMVLKKSQVPVFLEEYEDDLKDGPFLVDDSVKGLQILKEFDRIRNPTRGSRPRLVLAFSSLRLRQPGNFPCGNRENPKSRPALHQQRSGWIDCASEAFQNLGEIAENIELKTRHGFKNSNLPMDLFHLAGPKP